MTYQNPYDPDYSKRDPHPGVDPEFPARWSPRSFVKTAIPEDELAAIFDAARWAPSCFNEQPWRFLVSTGDTFDTFLGLLVESNQKWARNASVIGFTVAKKNFSHNGKPNASAIYDCGSAWMSLTMQARKFGLYTHGMAGIRKDAIYEAFGIDRDEFEVVAGFTIGVLDARENLDAPYAEREEPSPRKSLGEIWKRGAW